MNLRSKGADADGVLAISGRQETDWFITGTKAVESEHLERHGRIPFSRLC
jgi:hypothetical protein